MFISANFGTTVIQGRAGLKDTSEGSDLLHDHRSECIDSNGRWIQHAMHFVPPGIDSCKLCICENGFAKVSPTIFQQNFFFINNFLKI